MDNHVISFKKLAEEIFILQVGKVLSAFLYNSLSIAWLFF